MLLWVRLYSKALQLLGLGWVCSGAWDGMITMSAVEENRTWGWLDIYELPFK